MKLQSFWISWINRVLFPAFFSIAAIITFSALKYPEIDSTKKWHTITFNLLIIETGGNYEIISIS